MSNEELRQLAMAATPGPWHHCQPFMTLPAQRTIHGPVPAERVDYVSTWHGLGTPAGHSIVIGMAGRESHVRSKDMAFIAAANPAAVLTLLDENARLREALAPLKIIADRYDDNGLDEARPSWGTCVPSEVEIVQGRGGARLLTLQQCLDARAALESQETGQ